MDIVCWSCKTVTKLDNDAIGAAIKQMDASKLGFFDVPCSSCKKVNRTQRTLFVSALGSASTFASAAAPKAGSKAVVLARSLHVRADHSTKSETVAGLVKGQEVDVFETWVEGKNTWARIGEGTWAAVEYNGEKLLTLKA
jgi:hypothetical protein